MSLSATDELDLTIPRRLQVGVGLYALVGIGWFLTFPLAFGEVEVLDTAFAALSLGFAGGSALLVFRLGMPLLEVGWAVFTFSYYLRLLDELAEGPESVEALVPGTIELLGLAIILVGFVRNADDLQASIAERNVRLTVLNRVLRHNLRNDLSAIITALEHFRDRSDDDQDRELAEIALKNANGLSDLSDKLRRIDTILEGETDEMETKDLGDIVESAVDTDSDEYPGVTFSVTLSEQTRVRAAEGLAAAVENLVENAFEHNDADDPRVVIQVEADRETIAVSVRDNGPGIPSNELDPIRQGDESALSHVSGIGLWFVLWVVERSDGDIDFEYDGGQVVTMRFPKA